MVSMVSVPFLGLVPPTVTEYSLHIKMKMGNTKGL